MGGIARTDRAVERHANNEAIDILSLERADNGWIVRYGCVRLVFDDAEKLADQLRVFVQDPAGTVAKYRRLYRPNPGEEAIEPPAAPERDIPF